MGLSSCPPRLSHPLPPDYVRLRSAQLTWSLRASTGTVALRHILDDPDPLLSGGARILKTSGRCTLGLVGRYVIKRWDCRRADEALKIWLRGSRAARAGLRGVALERAGLATAPVVAWGERRRYGLVSWCYLITEYVADGVDLGRWQGDRLPVIEAVGDLIGRLHERGFIHRDLKPSNLLIARDGRPLLIDLDGLRLVGPVSSARALGDVVKLGRRMVESSTLSPREAGCFARGYCAARRIRSRRQWWKALTSKAGRHPEFQAIRAAHGSRT